MKSLQQAVEQARDELLTAYSLADTNDLLRTAADAYVDASNHKTGPVHALRVGFNVAQNFEDPKANLYSATLPDHTERTFNTYFAVGTNEKQATLRFEERVAVLDLQERLANK